MGKKIYTGGLILFKLYKIRIEKEFKNIYFKKLRKELHKKVKKIMKSGRKGHQFIFTGYSLGASMAVLASLDLTKKKLIKKKTNKPTVFTYGGLRIGDANFTKLINKTVTLWKIVKQNDFVVRTPNCFYDIRTRRWRCYTSSVLRRLILLRRFPLRRYYIRYIRPFIIRRRIIRKKVLLMRKGNRSFLESNSEIKSLVNERNSKISLKEKKSESKNEGKSAKSESKKAKVNTNSKTENKKTNTNTKSASKAKTTKMETKTRTKLATSNTNTNTNTNKNEQTPTRVVRRVVIRRPNPMMTKNVMRRVIRRRVLVRTTPQARAIRLRKILNLKYYTRFIYYSQALGTQIFYNAGMTAFKICKYVKGISSCELKFKLPATFSSSSRHKYYGIDFSKC